MTPEAEIPVSVVIVNNGRRAELALALKGLEYQRYRAFEVIVVTDLRPDARPDCRLAVRWVDYAERNISAARNLGIRAARGEIVAFIDDDAVPEFGWLAQLIPAFGDPAVGAAGGYVRGRNGVGFQWTCVAFDALGADHPCDLPGDAPRVFAPGPDRFVKTVGTNCAFRRAALADIGGFDQAYRFFLDEADVNLRLGLAGWSTAIVPLAEVHHGFAAGPHRSARRVPTSLFELGASQAHFLACHAPDSQRAARLEAFRDEQRRRLMRHFSLGRLSGRGVRHLMQTIEEGFAEGRRRSAAPARIDPPAGTFVPVTPVASGRRTLCLGRAAARAAAERGDEVTFLKPEPGIRPLTVGFTPGGYFLHRFGLLGRAERDRPPPLASRRRRLARELARIEPQRGTLEPPPET